MLALAPSLAARTQLHPHVGRPHWPWGMVVAMSGPDSRADICSQESGMVPDAGGFQCPHVGSSAPRNPLAGRGLQRHTWGGAQPGITASSDANYCTEHNSLEHVGQGTLALSGMGPPGLWPASRHGSPHCHPHLLPPEVACADARECTPRCSPCWGIPIRSGAHAISLPPEGAPAPHLASTHASGGVQDSPAPRPTGVPPHPTPTPVTASRELAAAA